MRFGGILNKFTKLSKFFLVFLLLLLILSMFIACGQSESKGSINIIEPTDDKDKFESTVTFISDGQTINTITIETGSKITSIPDVKK